ncbi:hypothetical protein [Georgenia thermotolerans]|uniref:ATP synthase subunit I n=1 Tax=Georgenia thermotolerans TaxID=527326 RepID=A0A7J5ULQ8_9MICO|nr:hypothetical protein [Georgenia thermotolerans]KAE8763094.1 hypothetical protein GB883_16065 [Georgenia thermotolerans]
MTDRPAAAPGPTPDTSGATRDMFRRILRQLTLLVVVLAVGGGVVGYLAAGQPGLWGALMGAGVAALFMVGTVATMLLTADKPLHVASAAGVGGWILKLILLLVLLALVRGKDFYSPGAFFVVLVLAIIGSFVIEARAVLHSRVPTFEPPHPPSEGQA